MVQGSRGAEIKRLAYRSNNLIARPCTRIKPYLSFQLKQVQPNDSWLSASFHGFSRGIPFPGGCGMRVSSLAEKHLGFSRGMEFPGGCGESDGLPL